MTCKIFRDILIWSLVSAAIAGIPPLLLVATSYDIYYGRLCANAECVSGFAEYYAIPLNVFVFSFYVVAVGVAVSQFRVNREARENQETSSFAANCISHLNEFSAFVRHELDSMNGPLSEDSVSTVKLHSAIFPQLSFFRMQSRLDRSSKAPSKEDTNFLIKELRDLVKESSDSFALPGGKFDFETHKKQARYILAEIGFAVDDLPRGDYYEVESTCIKLLNKLIVDFEIDSPPVLENPAYA